MPPKECGDFETSGTEVVVEGPLRGATAILRGYHC